MHEKELEAHTGTARAQAGWSAKVLLKKVTQELTPKRRERASYVHANCKGSEEEMSLGSPRNPKNSLHGRVPGRGTGDQ